MQLGTAYPQNGGGEGLVMASMCSNQHHNQEVLYASLCLFASGIRADGIHLANPPETSLTNPGVQGLRRHRSMHWWDGGDTGGVETVSVPGRGCRREDRLPTRDPPKRAPNFTTEPSLADCRPKDFTHPFTHTQDGIPHRACIYKQLQSSLQNQNPNSHNNADSPMLLDIRPSNHPSSLMRSKT